MELDLQVIRQQVVHATKALLEQANLKAGDIFVLGCSSSEICGGHIGKASSEEVGQVVIDAILPVLRERGIFLAVQGCEHINRSLVVEREAAERYDLEIVTVKPALHAGGACAVAAYDRAEDPVMVEHITAKAGMDIGHLYRAAYQARTDSGSSGHRPNRCGTRYLCAQPTQADRWSKSNLPKLICKN